MISWKAPGRSASVIATSLFIICSAGALCQQAGQNTDSASSPANSQSQSTQNPPDKNQHSGQSGKAAKDGSPDNNAFPMSQSEAAAKAASERANQQNQESSAQTPAAPPNNPPVQRPDAQGKGSAGSSQNKPSAAQDNPFPEAQSKAAAKTDDGSSGDPKSGSAQPDSSSAAGYSSSDANLPPSDLGQGISGSHSKLDTFTRDHTQDGRIEDDLRAADLYMKNGNYTGALWRYQDTLQYDPQNDTALYGVADAMCKQNLTNEAMARFKSYAKEHPQGQYAIKAEKMLAHPNKCMHNW
jgi:hypothetical protein